MEIKESTIIYPLPNKSLIEEEEKFWHIKLPKDYLDFIMRYNGGSLSKTH